VQAQVQVRIQSIINPVYKHYGFYYTGSQINNSFNLFRKDWDAVLLERLLGRPSQINGRLWHELVGK